MVRRKERQARDAEDAEMELEQDQEVHPEEDCILLRDANKGETHVESQRDVRAPDSGVGGSRSDTVAKSCIQGRGSGDKQVQDFMLHVSQGMSQISGALEQVVSVIDERKAENGAFERDVSAGRRNIRIPRGGRMDAERCDEEDRRNRTVLESDLGNSSVHEEQNKDRAEGHEPDRDLTGMERNLSIPRGRRDDLIREQGLEDETRQPLGDGGGEADRRDRSRVFSRDAVRGEGYQSQTADQFQDIELNQCSGDGPRRLPAQPETVGGVRQGAALGSGNPEGGYGQRQVQWGPLGKKVKIPPINGKEEWKVWFKRFEIIAFRQNWTRDDKLDNLIQRLEGKAAEFVFAQLPDHTLTNYHALVRELTIRYRKIETPRIFAAEYSNRNQKCGESVEDYAAELKRLYDRAHGHRDNATRQEDLVRRFLDGLWEEEARFDVEFHKEPTTIDEAVYFVVCYLQIKGKISNRQGNEAQRYASETQYLGDGHHETLCNHSIGRVPAKMDSDQAQTIDVNPGLKQNHKEGGYQQSTSGAVTEELLKMMAQVLDSLTKTSGYAGGSQHKVYVCFRCNEKGHLARECPKLTCFTCRENGHKSSDCPRGRSLLNHPRRDNQN